MSLPSPESTAAVEMLSRPTSAEPFPDEWYDESSADHFWFTWRLRALSRLLKDVGVPTQAPLRVLDIGSGAGILARQLEDTTAWTVDATDLNLGALKRCAPRKGRTLYYDVTEERPELRGTYDVALLFDVIEHVPQPRPLLESALRHLKPGGLLLINVPALPVLFSRYDVVAGHVRRYTRDSLSQELEGLPLRTEALRYWGFSLVPALLVRKAMMPADQDQQNVIERGFVPPSKWVDGALRVLMHAETRLAARPVVGTSVLYAGRVP
ncbi:class I SAM-dependent methyltransferase [Corallococcus llansteffanensis]|uniref:Class I SAM-dependent methyltransferase n=1 Tax=Corallococcus llansteffanensis TaxID=2316731 RepID=A0A3A8NSY2_9BACT|nr:class I SAM-dependent methyltransferase [Corallococcus llansteffanensis]RKH47506.1 class I SAM-dependent methyltransferase [Corallococcus llansteffanensis]